MSSDAPKSRARTAAARSLSTTASTPSHPRIGVVVDGRASTAARNHDRATLHEPSDHTHFVDGEGRRTSHHAAKATASVTLHRRPAVEQRLHPRLRYFVPNEFRRCCERGIMLEHSHLRDDRRDFAIAPGASQRVLERLLDHVADPSSRRSHEHAEWQWRDLRARELVAHELVAHLRAVAVHEAQVPSIEGEIDDGAKARTRVRELVADRAVLAGRRECVAAECDDRRFHVIRRHFLARLRSAPSASYAWPKATQSPRFIASAMRA